MNTDMKTYEKPTINLIEMREFDTVMTPLVTSGSTKANSSTEVLSNRRRNVWSSGWDE